MATLNSQLVSIGAILAHDIMGLDFTMPSMIALVQFFTAVTVIAGMAPLLLGASLQAQVLVLLLTRIVFGMLTSMMITLLVLPAAYGIMEDIGFIVLTNNQEGIKRKKSCI